MKKEWGKREMDPGHRLDSGYISPRMRDAAIAALNEAVAEGINPRIVPSNGGYRTPEMQANLNAKHPSGAASEGGSAHQLGLAFDICLIDKHGKDIYKSTGAGDDFDRLTQIMQEYGFRR